MQSLPDISTRDKYQVSNLIYFNLKSNTISSRLRLAPSGKMLQLSKFVVPIKLQLKCYIILILTGVENGLRDSMELFSDCTCHGMINSQDVFVNLTGLK